MEQFKSIVKENDVENKENDYKSLSQFAQIYGDYSIEKVIKITEKEKKFIDTYRSLTECFADGHMKDIVTESLDFLERPIVLDNASLKYDAGKQREKRSHVLHLLSKLANDKTKEGRALSQKQRDEYKKMYEADEKNKLRRGKMISLYEYYKNKEVYFERLEFKPDTEELFKDLNNKEFHKASGGKMGYEYDYFEDSEKIKSTQLFSEFLRKFVRDISDHIVKDPELYFGEGNVPRNIV